MIITGIEFLRCSASHTSDTKNWLVVKILTSEPGLFGLGDASEMTHDDAVMALIQRWFEQRLRGRNPLDSEVIWSSIYLGDNARGGRIMMSALAGIDIALWDLKGKILGQPVYRLLGGAVQQRLPAYANGWYTIHGSPEQYAQAASAVVKRGYRALKFDPFGDCRYDIDPASAQLAEDRVAAVREAVGNEVDILIEAHARFWPKAAIQLGQRLQVYRPYWYEEPVTQENLSELAEVRRHIDIPIATGEMLYSRFPFFELAKQQAVDFLQPDIGNAGGLTELKKIAAIAECSHMQLAPHSVLSPVGLMAEIHLGLSTISCAMIEYHAEFYGPQFFEFFPGLPRPEAGWLQLSDKPGLGLDLDEDAIARHPPVKK